MSAATTAAIIGSLIGAGIQTVSAVKQAGAAKDAAATQAAYGQKALDLQGQVYRQQQQNLSPYMNVGQQVLPQLPGLAMARPNPFTPPSGMPMPPQFGAPPQAQPRSPWDQPWSGSPR